MKVRTYRLQLEFNYLMRAKLDTDTKKLKQRLGNIWKDADFSAFFINFAKRSPHLVKKGTILFNEGDSLDKLFFIKEGFVKLFRLSDEGRETTIYLYGPNSILGVRALTSQDECARHFAQALTDLQIVTIPRKQYFEIVSENPEYLVDLLHIFISRLNYTEKKLEGFIITDITARVAYFLADCAGRFGKKINGKIEIPVPLTHQRIAEFVGSFRETVTLAVNKLKKTGVIKYTKEKITVMDIIKLNKIAGSSKN